MLLINIPNVVRNSLDIFLILPVPILQMKNSRIVEAQVCTLQARHFLSSTLLSQIRAKPLVLLANFVQLISGSILSLVPAIWKCALH